LEEYVLDAEVIDDIFNNPDPQNAKKLQKILIRRFQRYPGNPTFKKLSERLEELRDRAEKGLITSIEFVKELCKLARETVQSEKEILAALEQKSAKTALTELFLEMKTDKTPAVVERIVNDIDAIVKIVRFPGWQDTSGGEREVQKALRKALLNAGKVRLRPIFMTTLSTIFGFMPLAFALGQGAKMLQPLAIAMIGGMSVSMLISLLAIPTMYMWVWSGAPARTIGEKNHHNRIEM
jgi:predicted RND superfamily exporter protein